MTTPFDENVICIASFCVWVQVKRKWNKYAVPLVIIIRHSRKKWSGIQSKRIEVTKICSSCAIGFVAWACLLRSGHDKRNFFLFLLNVNKLWWYSSLKKDKRFRRFIVYFRLINVIALLTVVNSRKSEDLFVEIKVKLKQIKMAWNSVQRGRVTFTLFMRCQVFYYSRNINHVFKQTLLSRLGLSAHEKARLAFHSKQKRCFELEIPRNYEWMKSVTQTVFNLPIECIEANILKQSEWRQCIWNSIWFECGNVNMILCIEPTHRLM